MQKRDKEGEGEGRLGGTSEKEMGGREYSLTERYAELLPGLGDV